MKGVLHQRACDRSEKRSKRGKPARRKQPGMPSLSEAKDNTRGDGVTSVGLRNSRHPVCPLFQRCVPRTDLRSGAGNVERIRLRCFSSTEELYPDTANGKVSRLRRARSPHRTTTRQTTSVLPANRGGESLRWKQLRGARNGFCWSWPPARGKTFTAFQIIWRLWKLAPRNAYCFWWIAMSWPIKPKQTTSNPSAVR